MRWPAELSPRDEVAVVAFAGHPHLLLPFTTDRKQLETSLDRIHLLRATEETGSNIYGAVYSAAQKLFSGPHAPAGRKAILLLTDGQDSALGLNWNPASMFPPEGAAANRLTFEDVVRQLSTSGVEVYIASTENRPPIMTNAWFSAHSAADSDLGRFAPRWNPRLYNFPCGTCPPCRWRALLSARSRHAQRGLSPHRCHLAHGIHTRILSIRCY